jgi:hypothetical protein
MAIHAFCDDLVRKIKTSSGPKEAEGFLQDFVTGVLRKRVGKQDFAAVMDTLNGRLKEERENNQRVTEVIKLNAAIDIVEDYRTLI